MPREMFGTGSTKGAHLGARQWYTVPLSVLAHAAIIAIVVAVPLLATNALPTPGSVLAFVTPPPAPTAPPPPVTATTVRPPATDAELNPELAPTSAAASIGPEPAPQLTALVGRLPAMSDRETGVSGLAGPPPMPVPPPPPQRVGGDIKEPRKIHDVTPIYPTVALAARVEGAVILEATIARDGSVREVRVLRSAGILDDAAVSAVRQWRYTAPTLNGQPIDVLMTVTVRFGLSR